MDNTEDTGFSPNDEHELVIKIYPDSSPGRWIVGELIRGPSGVGGCKTATFYGCKDFSGVYKTVESIISEFDSK